MSSGEVKPVYTCQRCGAPLDIKPGSIVVICDYCGYPNIISGVLDPGDVNVVVSQPRDYVIKAFWRMASYDPDLSQIKGSLEIMDVRGYYFPAWTAKVKLEGIVSWYKRYREKVGDEYVTRTRYYRERINTVMPHYIPARRQVAGTGIYRVLDKYVYGRDHPSVNLVSGKLDWEKIRLDFLGVEIDKREASQLIADDAVDYLRKRYRERGDGIDFFWVEAREVGDLKLVYLPIWEIVYAYRGSTYITVFSGWDLQSVYRTEPVTPAQRAFSLLSSMFLAFISGPATLLAFRYFGGDMSAFAVPFALAGMAYTMSRSAFRGARVEK